MLAAAALLLPCLFGTEARAHGGEAAIVLLLPTGYYTIGAALAVAASFILLVFIPARWAQRLATASRRLWRAPDISPVFTSAIAFLLLALLVLAGLAGTADPVENPLPLVIWTVWWVCFTLLQAIVGPLWPHLNPWTGPLALIGALSGRQFHTRPVLPLTKPVGHAIALVQFFAFAWFELISLAPSDPHELAIAVSAYWLVNLAGALLFGQSVWMRTAEPFSIFFDLVGHFAPLHRRFRRERTVVRIVWPGHGLLDSHRMPVTGVLFVILTLATVSFDGLSRSFLWLGMTGVNPLEFPGRSAVTVSGTIGLVATFTIFSLLYFGTVALGFQLIGTPQLWKNAAKRLIYSIVPIAIAFQGAHYLTTILVDGQNALIALSDPFSLGWNLFGTAHWHTTTSFLNTLSGVTAIFNTQVSMIVLGHVFGIVHAHLLTMRMVANPAKAVICQIPLAVLMVAMTAFGLWLLSTPRI